MKTLALPPGEIKIKRKRTDEPVDLLRIHEPLDKKPRRATEFIFFRQKVALPAVEHVSQPNPINHDLVTQSETFKFKPQTVSNSNQIPRANDSTLPASILNSLKAIERHFHISLPVNPSEVAQNAPQGVTSCRKRKAETIFMERKPSIRLKPSTIPSSSIKSTDNGSPTIHKSHSPSHQVRKKPGLAARSFASAHTSTPKPPCNEIYPSRTKMSWDVKSDELVAELQAYTLSEIRANAASSTAESKLSPKNPQFPSSSGCKKPSRFIPKAPALRYKERHPEKIDVETDIEIEYVPQKEDENDDWVVDTFLRMPATALENLQIENNKNSGFLILDSQAEVEEFYHDETDSGEDDEDEDEDENAENHYTADYPDDEISSNDEYDLNAYHYSKDIDEFEADVLSDDDDDRTRYPWALKPWLGESTAANSDDTDDD
ncbi:hypothetical protein K3495_g5745 [Podosphaera aphanis]|nr:hypothetical protein K3495_g5745 [Podosphaera aphanis]